MFHKSLEVSMVRCMPESAKKGPFDRTPGTYLLS